MPKLTTFISFQVGWLGTAGLMIKTQMGLGVLSFPYVFDKLGMIPGVIILLSVAGITTWSNYIVGVFKVNHRHIYGVDDVGQLLFGRIGREVLAIAFMGRTSTLPGLSKRAPFADCHQSMFSRPVLPCSVCRSVSTPLANMGPALQFLSPSLSWQYAPSPASGRSAALPGSQSSA